MSLYPSVVTEWVVSREQPIHNTLAHVKTEDSEWKMYLLTVYDAQN